MNYRSLLCVLLVVLTTAVATGAPPRLTAPGSDQLPELERQFATLPAEARRLTGPLFWLHGDESPSRLEAYLEKVAEGGNGSFTAESRPHTDWLGAGWYRDLGICLEAAKKHDLQMWIFDEQWWPSGEVGGKVPERYASKYIVAAATEVDGPQRRAGRPHRSADRRVGRQKHAPGEHRRQQPGRSVPASGRRQLAAGTLPRAAGR